MSGFLDMVGTVLIPLQSDGGGGGAVVTLIMLLLFAVIFLVPIAGLWKVFQKAGKPGWAAIIPILNLIYILDIADKPTWWLILYLIPFISFIITIVVFIDVAKNFGKGAGYGLGLSFLPFVFWPLLGFGDHQYVGDTSPGI